MTTPDRPRSPRRYRTGRPDVDAAIDALLALLPGTAEREGTFARDLVTSAAKLLLDGASPGDVKLINSAVKELRYAFKIFAPHRGTRKVTVFGSARLPMDHPACLQAREFGARLAGLGWMVITGAGPGIMAAAHGGAGRDRSFGVNIHLPFEQSANETVRGGDKLVNFKYFFTRKLVFLKETDAIVLFPGGFGTHDEGFETLTLIQTGKADPLPVVFVEPPGSGYWAEWHAYVERHLAEPGLISPQDKRLYRITDDVNTAVDEVLGFYRGYHSQRYVGGRLVLRLTHPLEPARVERLRVEHAGLLRPGGTIEQVAGPVEGEDVQPEIAHLTRLVMDFSRENPAGLRTLIDDVNAAHPGSGEALAEAPGPHPADERAERGASPGDDDAAG